MNKDTTTPGGAALGPGNYQRPHGRGHDELRPVAIQLDAVKFAEGSAQIDCGDTRVLAVASLENRVPPFRIDSGAGWVTAEYSMLPRSTHTRSPREVSRGRVSGRTAEIQRLIGRSLRAVIDMSKMPGLTLTVDCDVLQADGGTRTASVTAAYVAAAQAFGVALRNGDPEGWPLIDSVAAVSVGVCESTLLLDLEYVEDSAAEIDFNVVATGSGGLVEVQGTGEKRAYSRDELDGMLDLALQGLDQLVGEQQKALKPVMAEVEAVRERRERGPAAPRDEADVWRSR